MQTYIIETHKTIMFVTDDLEVVIHEYLEYLKQGITCYIKEVKE